MYPDIKRIELTMIVYLGIRVDNMLAAEISATRDIPASGARGGIKPSNAVFVFLLIFPVKHYLSLVLWGWTTYYCKYVLTCVPTIATSQ